MDQKSTVSFDEVSISHFLKTGIHKSHPKGVAFLLKQYNIEFGLVQFPFPKRLYPDFEEVKRT